MVLYGKHYFDLPVRIAGSIVSSKINDKTLYPVSARRNFPMMALSIPGTITMPAFVPVDESIIT